MPATNVFYPHRKGLFDIFSVTLILIFLNVAFFLVFLALLIFFKDRPELLYDYIAIKPANILQGKYLWTFLTSMFMHGGLFHLFANMLSLMFLGSFVEKILGRKRYLYFYLASGLLAGLFFVLSSLVFVADLNTFAVGASGALFGLIGILVILTPNLKVMLMFIPIPVKMKYAGPGMLAVLWLISIAGNVPIGNTAHFGGLVVGVVYGIYLRMKYQKKTQQLNRYFS